MSAGYKCIGREIAATAGTTTAVAVIATDLWVRKAIVTHKGTGSNLKLGMADGEQMGMILFPTQSYTFEPSANFRFNLKTVLAQDVGEAVAHEVHVLAWI